MKIYNTMSKKKEEFVPIDPKIVKIYSCGPTVYNYIHIGNARPLCVFDVLRRFLEYKGYIVEFIQNFTDVDDKIIKKANEENSTCKEIATKYIKEYEIDATGLNIKKATVHPKATENINEIIDIIKALIEKGFAYKTSNGDVYFKTRQFKNYGKLSKQSLNDLESGARVAVDEAKLDPLDFALWKSAKIGEPYWESPWGKGRPGWHIECSAMVHRYLGDTIDIHCGGQDLIFPHHENEIAQSESCYGKILANYWMHNGYININDKKMSKSLNNFFTVREIADKYGYDAIRYLMISSHYRNPINYSDEIMKQCVLSLERLYVCYNNLLFLLDKSCNDCAITDKFLEGLLLSYKTKFIQSLDDDLNTSDALSALFGLVREINININSGTNQSKRIIKFALNLFKELSNVLGITLKKNVEILDSEIEMLIKKRTEARKIGDWNLADRIRNELKSKNILIEDTPQGTKWSKMNVNQN